MPRMLATFALILLSSLSVAAQGVFTLDEWVRHQARFMPQGLPALQWCADGHSFSKIRMTSAGPELVLTEAGAKSDRVVCTGAELAAVLAAAVPGAGADMLGALRWERGGQSLLLQHPGGLARVKLGALKEGEHQSLSVDVLFRLPEGAEHVVYAPALTAAAFTLNHNVHVLLADGSTHAATEGGSADLTHGMEVHRVEFGIKDGLWFSPDGKKVAFYREDFSTVEAYPYFEIASRPARAKAGRYPMAGQRSSVVSVGVHDLTSAKTIWLALDAQADEWHTNVAWTPDSSALWIAHVNRAQNHMELRSWDAASGERRALILSEADEQWIEPESPPLFVPDSSGRFLWLSVRSGFRHLHLFNAQGEHLSQVSSGDFDVQEFAGFDADGRGALFIASGVNPLQRHLFHVSLDGKQTQLTTGRGHHAAQRSADEHWLLDTHTNLELPKAVDLIALAGGEAPRRLHTAPDPFEGLQRGRDELFTCTAADGAVIHGWMLHPPEGSKSGPLLQYVYGGPHSQMVTDQWLNGGGRWNLWLATMAAQGITVFMADGRGTSQRGIEWQQAVHRRLGTVEVSDQIAALEHVLAKTGADPARVGVVGWSFGGFMTLSLMTRAGEHYRAGIAGAPVTDWAYYETGYGERYMDTPEENAEGYRTANPAAHVKGLRGRLLVVHGSADDTVVWQNTLSFLKACIDQGVEVETMIYPGELHGLRGRSMLHFLRKASNYFRTSL